MKIPRSAGIVLHPTSLPGHFGIGDLGSEAYRFVHFLAESSVKIWQVLPLGPTGYGDSPYQCFSAFAGNPLLISLERLYENGLLSRADLESAPAFPGDRVDFGRVIEWKTPVLRRAFETFKQAAAPADQQEFYEFRRKESFWLGDYALFRAVKDQHSGREWTRWEAPISLRHPEALQAWRDRLALEIEMHEFLQFEFFRQWKALRQYANEMGILIMGDIPIFVAHDSAEVWAQRDQFLLNADGSPSAVAGVPPDYFSATGQLWGNPLYRWDRMAEDGFSWWIERFKATFSQVDIIRLDHFRGFQAYWEVPANEKTAINGRWVLVPGEKLFDAVEAELGELPIVAENLGWITPEVEALRHKFDFPGMGILQFAFGTDPQASDFIPHNHTRDLVIYTGTHDNDTTVGWWTSGVGDSTRSAAEVEAERDLVRQYLNTDGAEINWVFIRTALASVAKMAVIPVQDLLGLGSESRMNRPGRGDGNWVWRFRAGDLTPEIRDRLKKLIWLYGRKPSSAKDPVQTHG